MAVRTTVRRKNHEEEVEEVVEVDEKDRSIMVDSIDDSEHLTDLEQSGDRNKENGAATEEPHEASDEVAVSSE